MLAVGSSIVSTLHIKGNVMIGYGRGGGGGGFGGLPYRSSHQQGQDGRGKVVEGVADSRESNLDHVLKIITSFQ